MHTQYGPSTAPLFLNGARVTSGFRSALFDAANRAGITPNEFVITAAAEKLVSSGAAIPGIFRKGDFTTRHRGNEVV